MSIFPNRRRIERRLQQFCEVKCPLGGGHQAHVKAGLRCQELVRQEGQG